MISLGIEQLINLRPEWLAEKRLGLLCNQASTDSKLTHSRDLINKAFPGRLTCLFSPQHGFFSEKQDNMVESDHIVDKASGIPVFSLYGKERRPTREMFEHLDVLLVDIFDVGTRVYTFLYTLAYCMEAAATFKKKVLILDRPNPLGGAAVEGNLLKPECSSFVGLYPLPMRHGLTFGELTLLINTRFGIDVDLEVIPMAGWRRKMIFRDTGLPWVFPSPNIPTPETALVYPGQVIWEGTNVSEGRGTTLPFELFGAPFIDHERVFKQIENIPLPGCVLRPLVFTPVSNKWAGEECSGFQIHITNPLKFLPYRTSLALLQAIMVLFPNDFEFKHPPYEYEYERFPLDLILGDVSLKQALARGEDLLDLEKEWQRDLKGFKELRKSVFLYDG